MSFIDSNNSENRQNSLLISTTVTSAYQDKDSYASLLKTLILNSLSSILYFISSGFINIITLHFVGIYSENLPDESSIIDGIGLAITSMSCVTSTLIIGLNFGLIALSSQAYGSGDHKLTGLYFHRSLIINTILLSSLSLCFIFTTPILTSIGIPELTAQYSAEFLIHIFCGLYGFMILDTIKAYLMAQGLFNPQLIVQIILLFIHWFGAKWFIVDLNLGLTGAAWAFTLTYCSGALLLFLYVMIFKPRPKSWFFFQKESLKGLLSMLKKEFQIGSLMFIEWIAFEITILMAGVYPPDEGAGQITFYNLCSPFLYMPFALGITLTSFTGKAMGEKNVLKVKRLLWTTIGLSIFFAIVVEIILINFSGTLVKFFTSDQSIIDGVEINLKIQYFIIPQDYVQLQLNGFIRGIGKEKLGFYGFVFCYYVIGLPSCYILGTILGYDIIGIRIGMGLGVTSILIFNSILIYKTDFAEQVKMIDERLNQDKIIIEQMLIENNEIDNNL